MVDVLNEIIKVAVPVAITGIIVPVGLKLKTLISNYIEKNVNANILSTGKEIWNVVEEEFRLKEKIEDVVKTKYERFVELIKEKFPSLSDETIYEINKSIAGAVNLNKESTVTTDDYINEISDLKQKLETSENAKSDLQNQIQELINKYSTNTVSNDVNNVTEDVQEANEETNTDVSENQTESK